jgi:hypothetical protein
MSQHHQINPQSDLRKVDIKISEQNFAQPEIQSHLENDIDDTETCNKMGTKNMEINNMTVELEAYTKFDFTPSMLQVAIVKVWLLFLLRKSPPRVVFLVSWKL